MLAQHFGPHVSISINPASCRLAPPVLLLISTTLTPEAFPEVLWSAESGKEVPHACLILPPSPPTFTPQTSVGATNLEELTGAGIQVLLKAILDYHVLYKDVSAYQFPPPGTLRGYFTLDTRCVGKGGSK